MISVILILIIILMLLYFNGVYNQYYWRKRGVSFYEKNKVFGPFWDFLVNKRALFLVLHDIYKTHPGAPAVGLGTLLTPTLYVTDPKNIKHVLQSDFESFHLSNLELPKEDLLGDNLFFLSGKKWKIIRKNMSPLFTSVKLKTIFASIDKTAIEFVQHLKCNRDNLKDDAIELITKFCCDAIGTSIFGISSQSTHLFLEMGKRAFLGTWKMNIKFSMANVCNDLYKIFKIKLFGDDEEFFITAVKGLLKKRKENYIKKNDFIDLSLEIQNKDVLKDRESNFELIPTDELIAAQGYFFFTAGVEPIATSMFATLFELGKHKNILDKVQHEIDVAYQKYNGNITADTLNSLKYLDKVLNEAMRMYPPVGNLFRRCAKDTLLPVGNVKVEKGTKIFIPIYELLNDPRHWVNPEIFDPERFTDMKNKDLLYYPFGKGNRMCIGERFARLQAKTGLFHILHNFNVKSVTFEGGVEFRQQPVLLRLHNLDIKFIPRNE